MDTQRLILFFVFTFSIFMLVDAWQRDQKPQATTTQAAEKKANGKSDAGGIPVPPAPASNAVPAAPQTAGVTVGAAPAAGIVAGGSLVKVETDVLRADISTMGGDIRRLEFKQHKGTLDKTKNFI